MIQIEDILKEKYPDLSLYQIMDLKKRLVRFYTCCAKIALQDIQNLPSEIPENSSNLALKKAYF